MFSIRSSGSVRDACSVAVGKITKTQITGKQNGALIFLIAPSASFPHYTPKYEMAFPHPPTRQHKRMARVVVVDDDDVIRRFVTRILEREGYDVTAFSDAADALADAALSDAAIADADLIITDLTMPTSGEVFIQNLRRRSTRAPIIVMSGHLSEEKAQYLLSLGVQAFIRKPFDLDEFLAIIQAWL